MINIYEFIYKCQTQIPGKVRVSIDIFGGSLRLTASWPFDALVCQQVYDTVELQASFDTIEHYRLAFVARCKSEYLALGSRDLHTIE